MAQQICVHYFGVPLLGYTFFLKKELEIGPQYTYIELCTTTATILFTPTMQMKLDTLQISFCPQPFQRMSILVISYKVYFFLYFLLTLVISFPFLSGSSLNDGKLARHIMIQTLSTNVDIPKRNFLRVQKYPLANNSHPLKTRLHEVITKEKRSGNGSVFCKCGR